MRRILLTNDDGISSEGLVRLAKVAKAFGEVWILAPATQCSGMSHHITIKDPVDVFPAEFPVEGVHAFYAAGTPADCVRIGVPTFLKGEVDAVISGINHGFNCGSDLQYSGTVAAALEGATFGCHSIALSEGARGKHEVTDAYLSQILEEVLNAPLALNEIWNVNFPECPLKDFKGIERDRRISKDAFYTYHYSETPIEGGMRYLADGDYMEIAEDGTDVRSCADGHISIGKVRNLSC